MSHGHKKEPQYGSRTSPNSFRVEPDDGTRVLTPGTPEHTAYLRKNAAELVRDIRGMWPTLVGGWTRRQWNAYARRAGQNYMRNVKHFEVVSK